MRNGNNILSILASGAFLTPSFSLASPPSAPIAPPVLEALQTINTDNGPTDQRINFVWISEGYSATEMEDFFIKVTNQWNTLVSTQPYAEYRTFLNCFMLPTVWNRAHPGQQLVDADYDTVYAKVTSWLPEFGVIIFISNDPANNHTVADDFFAYCYTIAPEVAVHEISHQFAKLDDEYDCEAVPNPERPNRTAQSNPALLKWLPWVTPGAPLPTPDTPAYDNVVGMFAHSDCATIFRPRRHCLMNDSGPLCEVCREAVTLQMYKAKARIGTRLLPEGTRVPWTIKAKVLRPIQSFQPAASGINLTANQTATFSVQVRQTATANHPFSYQWFKDGSSMAGATASSYVYTSDGSQHQIAVKVHDDSPFVRTDPGNVLSDSVFWTVNEPGISITTPTPATVFRAGIGLYAAVTSHANSVQRVDFYAGNIVLGSATTAPYQMFWTPVPEGSYSIRACAVSSVGGVESSGWSAPVQVAAMGWSLINLGANWPGGSAAFGLNDFGQVVGHVRTWVPSFGQTTHAFRTAAYTPVNPNTDILDLQYNPYNSAFKCINNQGVAVGNLMDNGTGNYQAMAFRALAGQQGEVIQYTPHGEYFSGAECINPSGTIVGWVSFFAPEAFISPPTGAYLDPGTGFRPSVIRGINNYGQMVGIYRDPAKGLSPRPFRITLAQAQSTGLASGDLAPNLPSGSEAWALNNLGQVTGQATWPNVGAHAFRTGPNALIQLADDLGTLSGGSSVGYSINILGQVVGESHNPAGVPKAFFYDSAMHDLTGLVGNPAGWVLHEATGINENTDICGTGTNNAVRQAFLLRASTSVPPPPVRFTFPADGASFKGTVGNLILKAEAGAASDATDVRVSFTAGTTTLGTDYAPPFNATWRVIKIGDYSVTATATDGRGVTASSTITVHVVP